MDHLLLYLIFSVGFNLLLFLLAYLFQTDKITDLSYSLTFIAISVYSFINSEMSVLDISLCLSVVLWGLRLGSYLVYRVNVIGHDARFDDIRNNFVSFLFFWVMQGLTCFIVMLPILMLNAVNDKMTPFLSILGLAIAGFGLAFETIADSQKFAFKRKNPSEFMKTGVWSWLQHPNYTGELLFWWALFIACIPYSTWYFTILGPLWISMIIIKFSGIRILQNNWKSKYGKDEGFKTYQKKTYKLIPFIY